jgi:tetratricopeptide (TPR) repeat protein
MPGPTQQGSRPAAKLVVLLVCSAALLGAAVFILPAFLRPAATPGQHAAVPAPEEDQVLHATYGKSPSCKSCHEEAYKLWEKSHHALAERLVDPVLDAAAFQSHFGVIRHGNQISGVTNNNGQYEIHTMGPSGQREKFVPVRVLGVDPLYQYIIPFGRGIYQMGELAFAPQHQDWFDVYGEENRHAGEWGHWTGRGMTWNTMCATCHNTRVRKNYRVADDSYATSYVEHGVGCESCHGPMADHNAWQAKNPKKEGDPTVKKVSREAMFAVCGSCHSRRGELTGDFKPHDRYFDHFALTIPDDSDLFYPDGQIRDEDFEFTAFMGSRMHASGVRCIDCHEPHAGKVRIPGNNLCLVCHAADNPPAPKIDIQTHSHHKLGERGDQCAGCHMPQTVYMQRHSRHDHGFTVPDPLMTIEFGIPNACNRCHTERDAEWSLKYANEWYGKKMERPARERTRVIARARNGTTNATALVNLFHAETNAFWRGVSAGLMRRWAGESNVLQALLKGAEDAHPLVRSVSLRGLEPLAASGNPEITRVLQARLGDTNRGPRIDAAWALRAQLDTNSPAGRDLLAHLRHIADQPSGALQEGVFRMDRGDLPGAMAEFQRALKWETNSAALYHALAIGHSLQNQAREAVEALQAACRLAPNEAEYRFKLGLALNETGQYQESMAALREAVRLDPGYAQAWYNLGLALNTAGQTDAAVESLLRAEAADPLSANIPYARATILARAGRMMEAAAAAGRALELRPGFREAEQLLRSIGQQ